MQEKPSLKGLDKFINNYTILNIIYFNLDVLVNSYEFSIPLKTCFNLIILNWPDMWLPS